MKAIKEHVSTVREISLPSEPTALERIEQNAKAVSQLRCVGSDEADRLADTLDSCREKTRCLNAACLVCGDSAQQRFIQTALKMWPSDEALVHITIMPSVPQRNLMQLGTLDLNSLGQHLKDLLDKASFANLKVLAFIDLCQLVDLRVMRKFWLPHYHLAATADDTQDLTAKFRPVLPSTPSVVRPVVRVKLNNPALQLHYISKPRPVRVTRLPKISRPTRPLKHWLKPREQLEANLWLGRYSVMDRMVALPGPVRSSEAPRNPRSA